MNIRSHSSQPVIGYIIVVIALAGMICYSLLFWDDMPAQVITRQAAAARRPFPAASRRPPCPPRCWSARCC